MEGFASLAGVLVKIGAPVLGGALAGPAGAAIGNGVGKLLGDLLGVEPTPEAIKEKLETDPEAIKQVQAIDASPLTAPALEGFYKVAEEAGRQVNATIALEVAKGTTFGTAWRPMMGYELAAEFMLGCLTVLYLLLTNRVDMLNVIVNMTGLLSVYFTGRLAVLGVYVWQRSEEKKAALTDYSASLPKRKLLV